MRNLTKAFEKETEIHLHSTIDGMSVSPSDDGSANTYSISKFFNADESFDFDFKQFTKDLKNVLQPDDVESTLSGFKFKKVFGLYELNYELELYEDASSSLEIFTLGSTQDSEELVKNLAQFMVNEFVLFKSILDQKEA